MSKKEILDKISSKWKNDKISDKQSLKLSGAVTKHNIQGMKSLKKAYNKGKIDLGMFLGLSDYIDNKSSQDTRAVPDTSSSDSSSSDIEKTNIESDKDMGKGFSNLFKNLSNVKPVFPAVGTVLVLIYLYLSD